MTDITLTDPLFTRRSNYNFFEKQCLHLIRDERDLPFIKLSLRIILLVIPVSLFLFYRFSWWLAIPLLLLNTATGLGPFILMLHNTSHRKLFKQPYNFMNKIIPWVLGPFYGETPETYFGHHVMMHHAENNLINDLSCTMNYQRDSITGFLKYFFLFLFFGIADLSYYFKRKSRWKFIRKILFGEIGFLVMCIILWHYNWRATLMVFVLPFIIARFGMMAGNWAQHAFIDNTDPANSYKNSITCINCGYNKTCFNDGYHIGHHLRPNMHWTDMPLEFKRNLEKYKLNDAIVFEGIDFFVIWFLLVTRNYKYLAGKYVDLNERFSSQEEIIAHLKLRVASIEMVRENYNANVIFNGIK
ncbi:MAG TPA: fatty acid desaturase [Chitinophagales bacterium]|nr:fatty acid desaturase [Chitinophagales bacterium]